MINNCCYTRKMAAEGRSAHNIAMHWVPEDDRRKRGKPKKTWRSKPTFKEDLEGKIRVSAGIEPAGAPVTDTDGELSSPDAPRGTGGHKSK